MTQDAKPLTAEELMHLREIRVCCCEPGCTAGPHCVAPVLDGIGADWISDHFDSILAAIDQQAAAVREAAQHFAAYDICPMCEPCPARGASSGDGETWKRGVQLHRERCWVGDTLIAALTAARSENTGRQADEPPHLNDVAAFGSAVLCHILADTSFFESEESEQWCELLGRRGYVERGIWNSAKHGEHNVLGDGDEAWIFTEKMRRDAVRSSAAPGDETPTITYWRRKAHEALDRTIEAQVTARLSGGGESDAYLQVHNETMFLAQQVVNHVTNARLAAARSEKA